MTFAHPTWLLLLAVPLLLAIWEATRRGRQIVLPLDHGQQSSGKWWARLLLMTNLLPAVIAAIAIVIVCRPLRPAPPKQEHKLTNIEFVLDVSGSMTSEFGEGSQYDAAMEAIEEFTSRRKGDAFGLTIFGNEVLRWTPLTKDLSAISSATPFLRPELLPDQFGGTEIGKAIRFSHNTLKERGDGDGMIILLSDGNSADLGGTIARQIGTELAEDKLVLYAIHVGSGASPISLYDLSRPTGGQVFAADSPEALNEVFRHIDEMQPIKLKPAAMQQVDAFGPFALSGLFATGLYVLSLFGLRYTPW